MQQANVNNVTIGTKLYRKNYLGEMVEYEVMAVLGVKVEGKDEIENPQMTYVRVKRADGEAVNVSGTKFELVESTGFFQVN